MKDKIFYVLLLFVIWPCHSDMSLSSAKPTNDANAPYMATWVRLAKKGNSYVVYNYPTWDAASVKTLVTITATIDSIIRRDYRYDPVAKRPSVIKKLNENSYTMLQIHYGCCGLKGGLEIVTFFQFDYVNKAKRIAKWTITQCQKNINDIHIDKLTKAECSQYLIEDEGLFVDSLYNTYPIIDYKWEEEGDWYDE